MLTVTIYPDAESLGSDDGGVQFDNVNYVSFVNNQTYGPPALIAPPPKSPAGTQPRARPGESVLYINTALVPAFEIVREPEPGR